MDLTEKNKKYIDNLTMYELLSGIRFAPPGDPWFQGETGKYWMDRYEKMRNANPGEHVANSKALGWERSGIPGHVIAGYGRSS